jgi:hypothetical protein
MPEQFRASREVQVNTRAAMQVADDWVQAHSTHAQGVIDLRTPLVRLIEETLSDSAATGVGVVDGSPRVLALEGDLLLVLEIDRKDGKVLEGLRAIPLDPKPAVEVSGAYDAGPQESPGQPLARERAWTISPTKGEVLRVETREVLWAQFSVDVGPDSGEKLMRTLAGVIGWPIGAPSTPR